MQQELLFLLEIVGTLAFAASGALVAVQRHMDFFGVLTLAGVTAVGGGCIRDVMLGAVPPLALLHPVYLVISLLLAAILFLVYPKLTFERSVPLGTGLILCDAVGLGVFTASAIDKALSLGFDGEWFLLIFVGTITGIGGGILRDLLAGRVPLVLRREIYAVASVIGGALFCALIAWTALPRITCIFLCTTTVILIRGISYIKGLHLPQMR